MASKEDGVSEIWHCFGTVLESPPLIALLLINLKTNVTRRYRVCRSLREMALLASEVLARHCAEGVDGAACGTERRLDVALNRPR